MSSREGSGGLDSLSFCAAGVEDRAEHQPEGQSDIFGSGEVAGRDREKFHQNQREGGHGAERGDDVEFDGRSRSRLEAGAIRAATVVSVPAKYEEQGDTGG